MADRSVLHGASSVDRPPPGCAPSASRTSIPGATTGVDPSNRPPVSEGVPVAGGGSTGRKQPVEEDWRRKGATLSDKTARKEFGLTQDEIEAAINAGQLQYRVGVVHGNPWLRLLRSELEALMESTYNDRDHRHRRAKAELLRVERDLKRLRADVAALEEHRTKLLEDVQE
jgi:hypothetical protein